MDISVSRVSWSFDSRDKIRPIGVVSKNDNGDRKTPPRAVVNRFKLAVKHANLRQRHKRLSGSAGPADTETTYVNEKLRKNVNSACPMPDNHRR